MAKTKTITVNFHDEPTEVKVSEEIYNRLQWYDKLIKSRVDEMQYQMEIITKYSSGTNTERLEKAIDEYKAVNAKLGGYIQSLADTHQVSTLDALHMGYHYGLSLYLRCDLDDIM